MIFSINKTINILGDTRSQFLFLFFFFPQKYFSLCSWIQALCSVTRKKGHGLFRDLLSWVCKQHFFSMWEATREMKHIIFSNLRTRSLYLGCLRLTSPLVYLCSMFRSSNLKTCTKSFCLQSLRDFCLLTKLEWKIPHFFYPYQNKLYPC